MKLRYKIRKKNKDNLKTIETLWLIGITGIVLIVASYAWFSGITSVYANNFTIAIDSSDGLSLSLDGYEFKNYITISKDSITNDIKNTYSSNDNHWVDEGLYPFSSPGGINNNASRLYLYAKYALTPSYGGYNLKANLINDSGSSEKDGYLVFDLFIKNDSGLDYYSDYNLLEDEVIYLSSDSSVTNVTYDSNGNETLDNYNGVANSLRIAFMQLGRVNMNSSPSLMQSISCNSTDDVTSLCNVQDRGITWNIWEPLSLVHNTKSLNYYYNTCLKRNSSGYSKDKCDLLSDDSYINTYSINSNINSSNEVNIYDGLNGYDNKYLSKMEYITDKDVEKLGDDKVTLFYLAHNSVTKVRIYIYVEGQDIDNYGLDYVYDLVRINFGFTKDEYESMDDY